MSTLIESFWEGTADSYGPRRLRQPCHFQAYVPDSLSQIRVALDSAATADLVDSEVALTAFSSRAGSGTDLEQLARFLLRAEAVASSKIEGLTVGARRLAHHEARIALGGTSQDATADWVLGNIEAMRMAVTEMAQTPNISVGDIQALHKSLMDRSPIPQIAGEIRTKQNWIGGNNVNPCQAEFVPPPPEYVEPLLQDLCEFINRDDLSPVVQAALVHAQFETIHPFADGNGRTGRALIHVVLRRRNAVTAFVPPISLALATDSSSYVGGLTAFRYVGEPDSEGSAHAVARWLEVFVTATRRAVADANHLSRDLQALELEWKTATTARRGSTANRALHVLLTHPIVNVEGLSKLMGVSFQAANTAVARLVDARVLTPSGNVSRNRLFEARDVFALLTKYERSIATISGDTRGEDPVRPVPIFPRYSNP